MNAKNKARSGFTLIELLVAIAIVAVIAAILFPVFGAVRERGRRTVCQSNLKQIAVAMQQYVQDNDGVYPSKASGDWTYATYSYLKNVNVFRCPDATDLTYTFTTDASVASVDNPALILSSPYHPVDYTYNFQRLSHGYRHGKQESEFATPATLFLNMDATWQTIDGSLTDQCGNQFWRMASTSCGQNYLGSTLHSGAGNYSYVDGHIKWLTPEEAGEIECANGPVPWPFGG